MTQPPDHVRVVTETGTADAAVSDLARVTISPQPGGLLVRLAAPDSAVKSVELHWSGRLDPKTRVLGDAWERSYADLGWRPLEKVGILPWYFLAIDPSTNATDGYGVVTGPAAMCHWVADANGVTLVADVRNGGAGVRLGGRTLDVCTVVARAGKPGETPSTPPSPSAGKCVPTPASRSGRFTATTIGTAPTATTRPRTSSATPRRSSRSAPRATTGRSWSSTTAGRPTAKGKSSATTRGTAPTRSSAQRWPTSPRA